MPATEGHQVEDVACGLGGELKPLSPPLLPTGAVMAALGQKGDTHFPLLIEGTSSNPAFKPDLKGIVSEKLKRVTGGDPRKAAAGFLKDLMGGKK